MSAKPKRKERNKKYLKKRYGGGLGCKERLRLKVEELNKACEEIKEAEIVLKEEEAHLRKQNLLLKR